MWRMEAGRFFRFARRLPAYQGVIRAEVERLAREHEQRRHIQGLADREIVPVPAGEVAASGLADLVADGTIDFG